MDEDIEVVTLTYGGRAVTESIKYTRSKKYGFMFFPAFFTANIDRILDNHLRPDDVILCTYPRCGTHWAWDILRMLQSGDNELDEEDKDNAMFEFVASEADLDRFPSPRVLNTHLPVRFLPREVTERRLKIVLVTRNPKDACVSWFVHHRQIPLYEYTGEFKNWIPHFLDGDVDWGAYSDYLREWEQFIEQRPDYPIHIVSYERMHEDPVQAVKGMSDFLGKHYEASFLQSVADACTMDKMREKKGHMWEHWGDCTTPEYSDNVVFRKGKVGGWKEWFTVAQSEEFDRQWAKATQGFKIFSFS